MTQHKNEASLPSATPPLRRLRRRHILIGLTGLAGFAALGGGGYVWRYQALAAKQAHTTLNFATPPEGVGSISSLQWLPDSRHLIADGPDRIQGWETTSGKSFLSIPYRPYLGFYDPPSGQRSLAQVAHQVKPSPDGETLAISLQAYSESRYRYRSRLIVLGIMTGQHLLFDQTFPTYIADLIWSPDGTRLVLLTVQNADRPAPTAALQLWQISPPRLLAEHSLPLRPGARSLPWITWTTGGTSLLALNDRGDLIRWNDTLGQQQEIKNYVKLAGNETLASGLQWTPDGKDFVAFLSQKEESHEGVVVTMIISPTQEPRSQLRVRLHLPTERELYYDLRKVVSWSPDARHMALAGYVGAYILDMEGHVLFTYTGQEANSQTRSFFFGPIAWSPDGKSIASLCTVSRLDGSVYRRVGPDVIQIWQPLFS